MTNSADPDQLASSEANSSGSTLFTKTGDIAFSKRRVTLVHIIKRSYKRIGYGGLCAKINRKDDDSSLGLCWSKVMCSDSSF